MKKYLILSEEDIKNKYSEGSSEGSPFDIGIPLFEISENAIQEIYYFRWQVYAKHIKKTPVGYVVTEFLPEVPWAGKYNTIPCPASPHFYEGRWLHNQQILSDYARFWTSADAEPRKYSFPLADSVYKFCEVWGDFSLAAEIYNGLKENYSEWEKTHRHKSGLFYQTDNRDGMELSISGNGLRPTINSYMYADALAISKIANILGFYADEKLYKEKADTLKNLINDKLWDKNVNFYLNLSKNNSFEKAFVRELIKYGRPFDDVLHPAAVDLITCNFKDKLVH